MQQMFLENRTDEAYVEEFRCGSFRHHRETRESVLLSLLKNIWHDAFKVRVSKSDTANATN
ncbi:hypothetical protein JCM19231_1334 [Vibrio ishigakensis]|uniref:Uncharacterized protein n=1 Tax=Vibrio ishigakensis TaxID=1481914 RepID=A0A0B8NRX3_9VIBR|nr:hypothetical protein [Vibrio ishigakensis]GAM57305.1 hypothetical protein JCM19231_1334 [Vibrio ishigakensis]